MAEISAQAVQQLREKTGLGLMQCKKALGETGGDLEKAVEHLRKQGAAVAAKRVGKETKEGKIVFASAGSNVAALEINCETDFVSASEDFNVFAAKAGPEGEVDSPDESGARTGRVSVAPLVGAASSIASVRATPERRARLAALASGWPSCGISWKRTGERSRRRARGGAVVPRSR